MPAHNFGEVLSFFISITLIIWMAGDINAVVIQNTEHVIQG